MRALVLGILVIASIFAGCLGSDDDFKFEPDQSGSGSSTSDKSDGSETDEHDGHGDRHDNPEDTPTEEPTPTPGDDSSEEPEETPESKNHPPEAFLEASHQDFFVPFTVSFELDGWDPDGKSITWSLAFGDGNRTTGDRLPVTLDHTYEKTGTFKVKLFVSDGTKMADRTEELKGSKKPTPVDFEGNILLPERFDLLGETCISEEVARSLIESFNAVVNNGNGLVEEANDNISEVNSTANSAFNGLLKEINGTVQLLNQTVYEVSMGEVSIPYENPNVSAPPLPLLPSIPLSLEYMDGATWDIHYVDPQFWEWNYELDTEGLMAQFWAENGTSIGHGAIGSIPSDTEFMVICMTSIPTDEEEFIDWSSSVPVDQEYAMTVEPPQELLSKPGPEEIDTASQIFEGDFGVGGCLPAYALELEGIYFAQLEEIDAATHGLPYQATFSSSDELLVTRVDFFGSSGLLERHESEPGETEIEAIVPDGAIEAFFSACGGMDVSVSYVAGN